MQDYDKASSSCDKSINFNTNLNLEYYNIKVKLVEHVLEHLGYSVDYLHSHPDTVKQLQKDIHWQKFNYEEGKEYLTYKGERIGQVATVFKGLSCYVEGVIYDNIVI